MNCLIIDDLEPGIKKLLNQIGLEADYCPELSYQQILACVGNYEGLILRNKIQIDEAFLAYASALKFIGRAGAGLEYIDRAALRKRGIMLINSPEGNRDAVGEHTLGLLLALFNKLIQADREVRAGIWSRERNRGLEIKGKTVGLIGYGNMGRAFAQRLSGFECQVLAYDKKTRCYKNAYAEQVDLEILLAETDVLSLHIPMSEANHNFISESFLQRFKKAIYLVNTARGGLISLKTIARALETGKLLGAALDVLECEDFEKFSAEQRYFMNKLQMDKRVLFSPHVAGLTYESALRINEILCAKIDRYLKLSKLN